MRAKLASLWLVVLVVLAAACGDTGSTVGNEDVIVPDNNVADQTGDTGQDTTQGCVDQDKDGAMGQTATCPAGTDCNDLATGIHPGAQEVCGNNVDEDCNGSDLACASPCEDKDGDQAQGKTASCPQGTDCDDANNTIHPGATEVCGNNVD